MAEAWRQAPDGGVRLVIYPDGTQGGEADMVKLMRVGTLQAGLFTVVGLSQIEAGVTGLQGVPMLFHSLDEFEYVNEKLRPMLEKRLAELEGKMLSIRLPFKTSSLSSSGSPSVARARARIMHRFIIFTPPKSQ